MLPLCSVACWRGSASPYLGLYTATNVSLTTWGWHLKLKVILRAQIMASESHLFPCEIYAPLHRIWFEWIVLILSWLSFTYSSNSEVSISFWLAGLFLFACVLVFGGGIFVVCVYVFVFFTPTTGELLLWQALNSNSPALSKSICFQTSSFMISLWLAPWRETKAGNSDQCL